MASRERHSFARFEPAARGSLDVMSEVVVSRCHDYADDDVDDRDVRSDGSGWGLGLGPGFGCGIGPGTGTGPAKGSGSGVGVGLGSAGGLGSGVGAGTGGGIVIPVTLHPVRIWGLPAP